MSVTLIGKCVACAKPYRHDGPRDTAPWCACRAETVCTRWNCISAEPHTHPVTAIRWNTLTATHRPSKACNWMCVAATSSKCACSCAGSNHGKTYLLSEC